jgi:hypothetical protein
MEILKVISTWDNNSSFDVEIAVPKLKMYKPPGADQVLEEMSQAGCEHYVLGSIKLKN